ncbi:MAG: hypothetical protein DCF25_00975 [Leptolyngbya foveolarum]|uniref:Uncharacterized protein n=1 Tax=Leptolyngbya foveolarum TaxID=47253 RepID=A0A2W4UPM3_9CYAN|nr:MAG: hypothetical protein DCF25_00975 [Leptolyngbya foveolarum]
MTNNLTSGLIGTLCIAAISGFQYSSLNRLNSNTKDGFVQSNYSKVEQTVEQLNILKNTPSFGFGNSIANWGFLQFLQYFGDEEARNANGYNLSPDYLSAVLAHDPYYKDFYLFLSESATFYAGMPDRTVEIIETKLPYLKENRAPDSYYVWRYKGTDELLFLDDSKTAQKSFEMAAAWAEESNKKDSKLIATLSRQTADFLASDPDSTQAKIGAWGNILTTSRDEQTQARAVQNIRKLGGEVVISDAGGVSIEYPPTSKKED